VGTGRWYCLGGALNSCRKTRENRKGGRRVSRPIGKCFKTLATKSNKEGRTWFAVLMEWFFVEFFKKKKGILGFWEGKKGAMQRYIDGGQAECETPIRGGGGVRNQKNAM